MYVFPLYNTYPLNRQHGCMQLDKILRKLNPTIVIVVTLYETNFSNKYLTAVYNVQFNHPTDTV